MRNFKIKVTTEQSEVIQKLLFLAGYTWRNDSKVVFFTEDPYLFFDDDNNHIIQVLTYSKNECTFINNPNPEITFEEFINEIEIELIEKFQNTCNTRTI